ncbi:MAG: transglutaminase-like domain-containing protein [Roseibacillus sp.]|nr:transglutaminase-like domain-containing protein [Roseibacillus sp.]
MNPSLNNPQGPPRLLEGAVLLFWGGVTGHPVVGLICALLAEGRSWTDLRWNFGEQGFVRAWYLAFLLGLLTLLWIWLQGTSQILLFDVLVWMPVYLLPVLLAQNYAIEPSMPLNTFSLIARRKMLIDRRAGRRVEPMQIHIGYSYLCLVMVAAGLSRIDELAFFVGMIFLASCALTFASPLRRLRPFGIGIALLFTAVLGAMSSIGLKALWMSLDSVFGNPPGSYTAGDQSQTAIGHLGEIKQSKRIRWRVRDTEAGGPRLFREAVYNHYTGGHWWHRPVPERGGRAQDGRPRNRDEEPGGAELDKREGDYEPLWDRELSNGLLQFAFENAEFDRDPGIRRKLIVKGKVDTKTPLPLPPATQRLAGFQVTGGGVDANSLGTVRLENPDHGVVAFDVFSGGRPLYEALPDPKLDLQVPLAERIPGRLNAAEEWIPDPERRGIRDLCDEWGLRGLRAPEAIRMIEERFFGKDFAYSIFPGHRSGGGKSWAVSRFLSETKVGHCEYFATAAVLLLREAGIPARYCVGYSGQEKSKDGEWLLRGSHAHAWCRVWHGSMPPDEIPDGTDPASYGRWLDFDATTPRWLDYEGSGLPWSRHLLDWWQKMREDFLVWRTLPGNTGMVNWFIIVVMGILLAYLMVRLWGRRTRRLKKVGGITRGAAVRTPLHDLARLAERWLGPRSESKAFTEWILGLGRLLPAMESDLRRAVSYHWKARFDPIGLAPREEGQFEELCRGLRNQIRRAQREK